MQDPADRVIDELFGDLKERQPGSKKTLADTRPDLVEKANRARHGVTTSDDNEEELPPWEEFAVELGGRKYYTTGALAVALNRSVVTIRRWERTGVIPKPPFRTRRSTAKVGTLTTKGSRLYLESHVVGLRHIAIQTGFLDAPPGTRLPDAFASKASKLFTVIHNKEKKTHAQAKR